MSNAVHLGDASCGPVRPASRRSRSEKVILAPGQKRHWGVALSPLETARRRRERALRNDPQGIRNRPEVDAFVLAHVLAVDLEREGPARSQRQLSLIVEGQDAAAARWPARGQHLVD